MKKQKQPTPEPEHVLDFLARVENEVLLVFARNEMNQAESTFVLHLLLSKLAAVTTQMQLERAKQKQQNTNSNPAKPPARLLNRPEAM